MDVLDAVRAAVPDMVQVERAMADLLRGGPVHSVSEAAPLEDDTSENAVALAAARTTNKKLKYQLGQLQRALATEMGCGIEDLPAAAPGACAGFVYGQHPEDPLAMPKPSSQRLFVCLELGASFQLAFDQAKAALAEPLAPCNASWTKGLPHLTLVFLGQVPVDDIASLRDGIRAAVSAAAPSPLEVSASRLGLFGSPKSPRVLHVNLEPYTELQQVNTLGWGCLWGFGFATGTGAARCGASRFNVLFVPTSLLEHPCFFFVVCLGYLAPLT
eukprot:m.121527 g.121527  ORF g.121527 m.121527 type:complete len:272 (+) comp16539_c1_seq5:60-875(+)